MLCVLCVLDVVVRVRVVCCVVVGTLVHTGIRVASDTRYEYTGVLFLTCCTRFFWSPDDWTAASSAVMLVGALHPHGIPCHVVKLPVTLRDETQRIGGVHECPIHTLNLFVEHVDNVGQNMSPKIPAQQEIYVDTPERRAATAFAQRSVFFLVVVDMPRVDLPSPEQVYDRGLLSAPFLLPHPPSTRSRTDLHSLDCHASQKFGSFFSCAAMACWYKCSRYVHE